jgi:hypothetical protein
LLNSSGLLWLIQDGFGSRADILRHGFILGVLDSKTFVMSIYARARQVKL